MLLTVTGQPTLSPGASATLVIQLPGPFQAQPGVSASTVYGGTSSGGPYQAPGGGPLTVPGAATVGDLTVLATITECVLMDGIPAAKSWQAYLFDNSGSGAGTFDYTTPQGDVRVLSSAELDQLVADVPWIAQDARAAASEARQAVTAAMQQVAAAVIATEDARAVVDAVRGDALYLRGEVPGGLRLYSLDPDRIRANSVTLRAAGTAITTTAVKVRFTS